MTMTRFRDKPTVEIPVEPMSALMRTIGGHEQCPAPRRCDASTELSTTQRLPAMPEEE